MQVVPECGVLLSRVSFVQHNHFFHIGLGGHLYRHLFLLVAAAHHRNLHYLAIVVCLADGLHEYLVDLLPRRYFVEYETIVSLAQQRLQAEQVSFVTSVLLADLLLECVELLPRNHLYHYLLVGECQIYRHHAVF